MPTIICSYCLYVGQQKPDAKYLDYDEMIMDVLAHEKFCPENPERKGNEQKKNGRLRSEKNRRR